MSKCCQYVNDDSKVCVGLTIISITEAQFILSKNITWTKKGVKGRYVWCKTCFHNGVPPRKFKTLIKTRFASKVIWFQKTLEFKYTIALCYGQQQSLAFQSHVLSPQVWAIAQVVVNTLGLVVQQCMLNQS
jgi:hypothetical protein